MEDKLELVKLMVEQGSLPNYLYKFRSINDFLYKILMDNALWFSKPIDFNDPFDCQIQVDTNNTYEEILEYLQKNNSAKESEGMLKYLAGEMCKKPALFEEMVNRSTNKVINNCGICCFSKNWNNILQWSHYADSHKGVALKFEVLSDTNFFYNPVNVLYSSEYPIYNHIKEPKEIINKLIKIKAEEWSYEEEVRIFKRKSGLFSFNKSALVEIIFGAKCKNDEIEKILKLAKDSNYPDIKFSKTKLKNREFGLEIVTL